MKREIVRVEPFDDQRISRNGVRWSRPALAPGDMVFISGMPPFDPKTGEILVNAPFEQQAERILEQLKTALEATGSGLEHVARDRRTLCKPGARYQGIQQKFTSGTLSQQSASPHFFFCMPVWTGPF